MIQIKADPAKFPEGCFHRVYNSDLRMDFPASSAGMVVTNGHFNAAQMAHLKADPFLIVTEDYREPKPVEVEVVTSSKPRKRGRRGKK
ncbi:MAG: hypothetical protein WC551_11375 [Patescibacteria group bacterium]